MSAVISDCGRYRYALEREWMTGEGICLFVMLNPSTADANEDDPTIRRCIGFAQSWGYQRLAVGNLYAFRATDPRELGRVDDPVGPENYEWLDRLVADADAVIAAWGATAGSAGRGDHLDFLPAAVRCLGLTRDGHPRHPLYIAADTQPVPFTPHPGGEPRAGRGTGREDDRNPIHTLPPEPPSAGEEAMRDGD